MINYTYIFLWDTSLPIIMYLGPWSARGSLLISTQKSTFTFALSVYIYLYSMLLYYIPKPYFLLSNNTHSELVSATMYQLSSVDSVQLISCFTPEYTRFLVLNPNSLVVSKFPSSPLVLRIRSLALWWPTSEALTTVQAQRTRNQIQSTGFVSATKSKIETGANNAAYISINTT